MAERKSYSLSDLVTQCDPGAPMPEALRERLLVYSPLNLYPRIFYFQPVPHGPSL